MNKKNPENLINRDKKTIEEWFLNYADSIYMFIYRRVEKDRQTAIDILQDTFLEALGNINKYQPSKGNVLTWLILLSRNHIKKALRQKTRFSNCTDIKPDGTFLTAIEKISDEPLPDEIIEKEETAELVQITLATLPKKYRDVLNQFYYQQKMMKQIASDNGQSQIAAKITLYRARNAFRKAFLKTVKLLHNPCSTERGIL